MKVPVALLAESVDRNSNPGSTTLTFPVALLAESVDRNVLLAGFIFFLRKSLSLRRAWIEILCFVGFSLGAKGRSPCGERG